MYLFSLLSRRTNIVSIYTIAFSYIYLVCCTIGSLLTSVYTVVSFVCSLYIHAFVYNCTVYFVGGDYFSVKSSDIQAVTDFSVWWKLFKFISRAQMFNCNYSQQEIKVLFSSPAPRLDYNLSEQEKRVVILLVCCCVYQSVDISHFADVWKYISLNKDLFLLALYPLPPTPKMYDYAVKGCVIKCFETAFINDIHFHISYFVMWII